MVMTTPNWIHKKQKCLKYFYFTTEENLFLNVRLFTINKHFIYQTHQTVMYHLTFNIVQHDHNINYVITVVTKLNLHSDVRT